MASKWSKPDYHIGKDFSSTYDLLKHDYVTTPYNQPLGNNIMSNRYYKHPQQQPGGGNYHDDVINAKMASGRLPDEHHHQQQQYNNYSDTMLAKGRDPDRLGDLDTGAQTFREDPRYGSAQPRSRNANPEQQYATSDYSGENKPWLTHRDRQDDDPYGLTDPRGGHGSYYNMAGYRSRLKHGGALLFIRFPTGSGPGRTDNIGVASQAFLKSKTFDLGGKFLGIAKSVYDFGYPSGPKDALGLFHFPSPEKAKLFFQYDMIIRQPDFPPPYGHAEIWTVSNAYLPDSMDEYNTFLLSEVMLHHGRDKREFFELFQKPFEKYLHQNEVMPFVVCSYGPSDRECLRRHAYHHQAIVTCHLFKGLNHLRWLTDQETYSKFRGLHNQMADERCTVFTIDRHLCP